MLLSTDMGPSDPIFVILQVRLPNNKGFTHIMGPFALIMGVNPCIGAICPWGKEFVTDLVYRSLVQVNLLMIWVITLLYHWKWAPKQVKWS